MVFIKLLQVVPAHLYTNLIPTFSEHPDSIKPYEEMSYNDAIPYYKELNYNYGPGKNSQRSEDFFGLRAFHYAVFNVKKTKLKLKYTALSQKKKLVTK